MALFIQYHPSGQGFVTASEDKTARLWDFRSDQELATFKPPNSNPGFTSCGLSLSGRFIFCGSDDNSIHIWDTLKNQHNGKSIDSYRLVLVNCIFIMQNNYVNKIYSRSIG